MDDIPAAARYTASLDWFYKILSCRFNAKDLGEIGKIFGMRVTWDRKNCTLYLDQEIYLTELYNSIGIAKAKFKPRITPANNIDSLRHAEEGEKAVNAEQYR